MVGRSVKIPKEIEELYKATADYAEHEGHWKEEGIKHDTGKLDYTLIPWVGMDQVVRVLMYGADKYSRDNWKLVERERYVKAAFRHLIDYASGKVSDKESGQCPLAHAACCLLFILALDHADHPSD